MQYWVCIRLRCVCMNGTIPISIDKQRMLFKQKHSTIFTLHVSFRNT